MINVLKRMVKNSSRLESLCRRIRAVVPFEKRLGRNFSDFYALLEATQYEDREKIQEMQLELLLNLIRHAYNNSAFYRRFYDEHSVNVSQLSSFYDIKKEIPVVYKALLSNSGEVVVPSKGMYMDRTSGTTGVPFRFYKDSRCIALEWAAIYHQWERVGFSLDDIRVEIRGNQVEAIKEFPDFNFVRFSTVNMEKNIKRMTDYLNAGKIRFIHGYPSAIAEFSRLVKKYGLKIDCRISACLLASETVYDWEIKIIKAVLSPDKILAHYGVSEQVAQASWCESSDVYHFMPLYGFTERGPGGEIIATGFLNRVTPFIRFQTGDIGTGWSSAPCPFCKRGYSPIVEKIEGRAVDYVVTEDGKLLNSTTMMYPFDDLIDIRSVQLVQRKDRTIEIRYVNDHSSRCSCDGEKAYLERSLKKLLGDSIRIDFKRVEKIPLTEAGKLRPIISYADKV